MIKIFQYYVEVERSPHRLASVSTTWGAIVMGSPTLWCYIDSNQSRGAYLNSLARSKGAPLVVDYRGYQGRAGNLDLKRELKLFIDSVCGQLHRWQSASLQIDRDPKLSSALASHLACSPAPLLEELVINGIQSPLTSTFGDIDHLFGGVAQRLRHVELRHTSIPWNWGFLSHLHTLTIIADRFHTASHTAQILRGCPLLTELRLHMDSSQREDDVMVPGVPPIELQAVKVFALHLGTRALNHILQMVRIRNCTQFHISSSELPMSNIFSGATSHLIPVLTRLLSSADFIDIYLSTTQLTYKSYPVGDWNLPPLLISFYCPAAMPGTSLLGTLAWMLDHVHTSLPSIPVKLSIVALGLPLIELFDSLQLYPVINFSAQDDGRGSREVIPYLSDPVTVHGVSRWRLPSMRELFFEECSDIPLLEILSLVESRLGRSNVVEPEEQYELPVKLTKLCLPRRSKSSREAQLVAQKLEALVDVVYQGIGDELYHEDGEYDASDGSGSEGDGESDLLRPRD
ncbi:hypothetical protein FRB94_009870 [Tulasnella sp. JGI-2019a]|nr:hypothetical protein FRB94_009870 [Tulasnella sp. JGI-2019a]